jgi:hypothetical protein
MTKKKLYIVLGKSNSRKSSVIRCLSGCRDSRGNWKIAMTKSTEKFYVSITSPQERNGIGINPKDFVTMLLNIKEDHILLALQSTSSSSQPNGHVYLDAFITAGFDIQIIACFDSSAHTSSLPIQVINDTASTPSNATASELRKFWGMI